MVGVELWEQKKALKNLGFTDFQISCIHTKRIKTLPI